MGWRPMRSALDPRQRRPKNPKPKAGPDLCADCQHPRKYHNAVGCLIENCWCGEFTRTATANHCACQHDGRGELTNECQEHQQIREQRDCLLAALKAIVETADDCPACDRGVLRHPENGHWPKCPFGHAQVVIAAVEAK